LCLFVEDFNTIYSETNIKNGLYAEFIKLSKI